MKLFLPWLSDTSLSSSSILLPFFFFFSFFFFSSSFLDCHSTLCAGGMFKGSTRNYAIVVFTLVRIAFWFGVAGVLHYKKWYYAL